MRCQMVCGWFMSFLSDARLKTSTQFGAGVVYALISYTTWGLLSLYWKWLSWLPSEQAIAHRITWSFALLLIVLAVTHKFTEFFHVFRRPKLLLMLTASGSLIACNWYVFVWAVAKGEVVEASLGYFINPLISVLFGVVFLKERLSNLRWLAVVLATFGVLWQTFAMGTVPWIALLLAGTFALYGFIRKFTPVSATVGLTVETLLVLPIALGYLLWVGQQTGGTHWFSHGWSGWIAVLLTGVVTTLPLVCFANAARRLPLSTLGFFQYLAPTIQLGIAIFVFHEPFTPQHFISFGCIWLALLMFSAEPLLRRRH